MTVQAQVPFLPVLTGKDGKNDVVRGEKCRAPTQGFVTFGTHCADSQGDMSGIGRRKVVHFMAFNTISRGDSKIASDQIGVTVPAIDLKMSVHHREAGTSVDLLRIEDLPLNRYVTSLAV